MAKSLHQGSKSIVPYLHIFVEEPSAKIVLDVILPKIIVENAFFQVHSHQGKQDLEHAIKTTIPSISKIPGARILVMRDQDNEDCKKVKKHLLKIIKNKSVSPTLVRIVCRELEAWFLGDLKAVSQAYPRVKPQQYITKSDFRNVDLIQNANEFLLAIIPEYKNRDSLPKLEVAESVAPYLDLANNSSSSFTHFISGVNKLISAKQK